MKCRQAAKKLGWSPVADIEVVVDRMCEAVS